MRHATTNNIADNVANGINFANGARKQIIADNIMALTTPANGEFAPIFMLAAVRAIDPVVAIPPNNGETIFAIPCAINSWLES